MYQDWTATWPLLTIMGVPLQASKQVIGTISRRLGWSVSQLMALLIYSVAKL